MTPKVTETRLPGIGVRYTLRCSDGDRVSVVLRNDGASELYTWNDRREGDPPTATVDLDLDETRRLSAILGGAYERPTVLEDLEYVRGDLQIEWTAVPPGSPAVGHTLADCGLRARTGVTVVAILREPQDVVGARPEDVVVAGDVLVTAGTRGDHPAFRALLETGPFPAPSDLSVPAPPPPGSSRG